MGYPHIRGTVVAAEWQPSFIHLWPGIGCPDFLRPFEDTPPPSAIATLEYPYAHSGVAVGFFAPCARPRCRGPPPVSEICSQPNFRIRRNHIWALIMRQKRRSLKRCGQDSGVSIGRPGCPMPPSGRCMTSIGRYSNRRGEDLSPSYAGLGHRYLRQAFRRAGGQDPAGNCSGNGPRPESCR